jgi:hypothetical protein
MRRFQVAVSGGAATFQLSLYLKHLLSNRTNFLHSTMNAVVRAYTDSDYEKLIRLYEKSRDFKVDPETDAQKKLAEKIRRDPDSILVIASDNDLLGSVSIIEDGRIAILFRMVAIGPDQNALLSSLVEKAEKLLKAKGYAEVHSIAPEGNTQSLSQRKSMNFTLGKKYVWFWKKL